MKKYSALTVLILCVVALAAGVIHLFELRFAVGDVYPPYSTLRSDPLGTMALYESLGRLPDLAVDRDYATTNSLPAGKPVTYIHAAATVDEWLRVTDTTLDEIDKFVSGGGRFVITMTPATFRDHRRLNIELKTLSERWHIGFKTVALTTKQDGTDEPAIAQHPGRMPLPQTLAWHSGGVLANPGAEWTIVYARGADPVMVERAAGSGTLVIATDSYFLSNEAMQRDRHADLLAWLVGPSKTVTFDEAHLGVSERSGVATLMRKYRLQGFLASLVVLFVLFVWKNSFSFVPARAPDAASGVIAGKSASEGFDHLLRRNIRPPDILATCFAEWRKSAAGAAKHSLMRIQQAEAEFRRENSRPANERNPVRAYQEIAKILRAQIHEHRSS